jgi:hypothetical protein
LKWQDWPTFLATVRELRRECAGLAADGATPRGRKAVAWSLQRYLIFAIFSCVPDRQRTLRELEVGRTLVREEGRWLIRHGPGDYKTGRSYGERPPLVIAPDIYPELEAFIGEWRAELEPSHNLLFTQRSGGPLTDKSLYELFWKVSYRLTGRRTNPHLLRDSIVTFLRGSGNASERELEALSLYMGADRLPLLLPGRRVAVPAVLCGGSQGADRLPRYCLPGAPMQGTRWRCSAPRTTAAPSSRRLSLRWRCWKP